MIADMKTRFFLLASMALLALSCSGVEEDKPEMGRVSKSFYAEIEQPSSLDTKVYADEDLSLLWDANDLIAVFDKYTYGFQYKFTGEQGSTSGKFVLDEEDDGFIVGNDIDFVCAVYPYDAARKIDNSGSPLTLTLPAAQSYLAGSFGRGANTMVSCGDDVQKLSFKNVCGYLAFKLYGEGVSVSSITLKSNNSESIAGKAEVKVGIDADPTLSLYTQGSDTITLECADPVQLGASAENSVVFWMVVPPTAFTKGFTITVKDKDGKEFVKTLSRSFEVKRNTYARMAALQVTLN